MRAHLRPRREGRGGGLTRNQVDVVMAINRLSRGKPQNTAGTEEEVLIADAGALPW